MENKSYILSIQWVMVRDKVSLIHEKGDEKWRPCIWDVSYIRYISLFLDKVKKVIY